MIATPTPITPPNPAKSVARKTTLIGWMRRHPVVSYFVLAFGLSWAVWIPMALAGARVYEGQAWPTDLPGIFGPLVAAFIMSAVVAGGAGIRGLLQRMARWRVAGKWYLVALSPLAFYAVTVAIQGALGQGWPDLSQLGKFSGLPLVAIPVMLLLLLLTAYPEETGWRGFAAEEMLKTRSFLWTTVVIGLLWALWHVPGMFVIQSYSQMGIASFPMFTLGIVAGSILLTWLYLASGHKFGHNIMRAAVAMLID
jgi:uncharacterized protein